MSEVDTCLQKLLHRNYCHVSIPPVVPSAPLIRCTTATGAAQSNYRKRVIFKESLIK
ncbi:hypothetical protein HMPREF9334_00005 [Selenomonas infelix ATCC 43532]|uniref:Uncharacterized protein n=1 Tax=Selenomonas infelix ATCC 43532 TaxID=679201 RepID=G5GL75_9FIRM|nr:hypothetical protein HMPREF9334_00005 [Selenomonas infelix ATCC 43532]